MKHIFLKGILFGLFLITFAGSVQSQIIEGVVFNNLNEPLPGATVSIKSHRLAVSTNNNGEFKFFKVPAGEVQLKVSFIGYKSQTKTIRLTSTSHETLNFYMKVETTDLAEVSVFGTAGSPNNTEEISDKYLQRTQATDMKDIFINLPSVTVGGGGANAQRLYLRGIEGSNLNITIDGAKQGRSLFQHRGNAGSIDPGLLKRVDVSTGSDATRGSGGLGGNIALKTIDAQDLSYRYGKIGGRISTGLVSVSNGYVTRATVGTEITPHIGLLLSASLDDQNNYAAADSGVVANTATKTQNYFAKLSVLDYKYHELRLSAGYNLSSGDYITGGPGSDMGIPDATRSASPQDMERGTYTLDYRFLPDNPLVNVSVNAYYNHRNLENKDSQMDVTNNNLGANAKNVFKFDISQLKNTLTAGTDYEKENGITAMNDGTHKTNSSEVWGLFVQGLSEFSFLSVSYGLRLDDYTSDFGPRITLDGNEFSPNVGVAVVPVKGLQLFANYSEAVRATGTIPIQWLSNIADTATFNNGKPFEPETSTMQETGIKYVKQELFTPNDKLTFSAKIFKTEMDNLIESTEGGRQGAPITGIGNDTLGVVSKGYEFALNWQTRSLQARLSYLHTDVEDETGTPVAVSRRKAAPTGDRFNLNLLWQATPEIQLGYTLNSVGELKDVYETAREAYSLHNIQVLFSPQSVKGLTAAIAVNNLFNTEYSEQTSIAQGNAIIPEPGRDIRLTLAYNF